MFLSLSDILFVFVNSRIHHLIVYLAIRQLSNGFTTCQVIKCFLTQQWTEETPLSGLCKKCWTMNMLVSAFVCWVSPTQTWLITWSCWCLSQVWICVFKLLAFARSWFYQRFFRHLHPFSKRRGSCCCWGSANVSIA